MEWYTKVTKIAKPCANVGNLQHWFCSNLNIQLVVLLATIEVDTPFFYAEVDMSFTMFFLKEPEGHLAPTE